MFNIITIFFYGGYSMKDILKRLSIISAVLVVGLLVQTDSKAAQVTNIFRLNMDGAVSGGTYTADSGGTAATVILDEDGNAPIINSVDGVMYMNGQSPGPYTLPNGWQINGSTFMPRCYAKDEALVVSVGSGYVAGQSYIAEAWVKPDYSVWPTSANGRQVLGIGNYIDNPNPSLDGDNNFGQISIFRWGYSESILDPDRQMYGSFGLLVRTDGYTQRAFGPGINVDFNTAGEPNDTLSYENFTHVASVYQYNAQSGLAEVKYYVNGQLKASGSGAVSEPDMPMASVVGIGNQPYSNFYSVEDIIGIDYTQTTADTNYNAGWSGWIQSAALSTFEGDFDGAYNFVLLDPQFCGDMGTEYKAGDYNHDCRVDLEDFMILAEMWTE